MSLSSPWVVTMPCSPHCRPLAAVPRSEVTGTFTIPKFFHSDGYLAEEAWRAEVERLRQAFGAAVEERKAKKDN